MNKANKKVYTRESCYILFCFYVCYVLRDLSSAPTFTLKPKDTILLIPLEAMNFIVEPFLTHTGACTGVLCYVISIHFIPLPPCYHRCKPKPLSAGSSRLNAIYHTRVILTRVLQTSNSHLTTAQLPHGSVLIHLVSCGSVSWRHLSCAI